MTTTGASFLSARTRSAPQGFGRAHGSFPGGCRHPERRRSVTSAFALSASGTAREFHAQDR